MLKHQDRFSLLFFESLFLFVCYLCGTPSPTDQLNIVTREKAFVFIPE